MLRYFLEIHGHAMSYLVSKWYNVKEKQQGWLIVGNLGTALPRAIYYSQEQSLLLVTLEQFVKISWYWKTLKQQQTTTFIVQ